MFASEAETLAFLTVHYPDWIVSGSTIDLCSSVVSKSEEVPSIKLIAQTLGYATELERIV